MKMMKLRKLIMCFALLVLCLIHATSKPIVKKDRVYHEVPLSNRKHDDSQNFDYDHDAFLGQEEAKTFDHLAPVESKNRLGMLVERIDEDMDGYVTVEEMKKWIKQVQNRWMYEDVDRQWKSYDLNRDGLVSWEEYKNSTSRYMRVDPHHKDGYLQMAARDERRFKMSDLDADMKVNKEEFAAFLHPEQYDHMKDLLVMEALEDIDKNRDGQIDLDEYIGDMFKYVGEGGGGDPDEHLWMKTAKEHFKEFRDKNKDGKMDKEEIRAWILPDTDYAGSEAKHLVHMSDMDGDGRLTRAEIMNKYNLFVGSMATDFGQALHRPHDEF